MLHQWSNIMMEFSDSIDQYRDMLKIISLKEASLLPSRDQKRRVREKMDQLQGSLAAMDKISNLQEQLEQLEAVTESDEIEMDNFRRATTSKALYMFLDGMSAMAGKTNIISTFGKNVVDELHVVPLKVGMERPVYQAEEKTKLVVEYVQKSVYEWDQQTPELNQRIYNKQLPPVPIKSVSASSSTAAKTPSPVPIKSVSTGSTTTAPSPPPPTNKSGKVVFPPRHVSLEEQHKQYSFYKPDQVDDDDDEPTTTTPPPPDQPHLIQSTSSTTTKAPLQNNEGGFSNMYLNTHHQQRHQYRPNREYEELASSFNSGAVFRGSDNDRNKKSQRHDAGGFVLPSTNPNYIYPSKSTPVNSSTTTDTE